MVILNSGLNLLIALCYLCIVIKADRNVQCYTGFVLFILNRGYM
jgi:hypothetical protein